MTDSARVFEAAITIAKGDPEKLDSALNAA